MAHQGTYTVLPISDGQRKFPFLYDGTYLYVPDYNPEAYGQRCGYRLNISTWITRGYKSEQRIIKTLDFDARDFEAIPLFRYNGHTYRQAVQIRIQETNDKSHYVELLPLIYGTDEINANFDGAQGIELGELSDLDINIAHRADNGSFQMRVIPNQNNLIQYIKQCYGGMIEPEVRVSCEMALVNESDMYWVQKDRPYSKVTGSFTFELNKSTDWFFNWQHQYIKDLEFVAIMHIVVTADEHEMHVDIRSNPYPLTEQVYAEILKQNENTIDISEMVVQKPRIINKTVQKTVIMNSQTDSKSNIIQPVFFRSRDLAQIIVHPEVTENICINLDAYKSQVERFYIKIEGIAFEEIGRVESGIIFKVKGNLLPGERGVGTYYILNENADLVTTGKYIYDR